MTNGTQMMEACYTCRRRRIQCDRLGIPCGKCRKGGLECHEKRPIKWVKGVAIRGKMQGFSYDLQDVTDGAGNALVKANDGLRVVAPGLEDEAVSSLDKVSKYYLDYCINLISLALKDPLLLQAALALAARHRANEGQSFDGAQALLPWMGNAQQDALVFKHKAIQGLSQVVGDAASSRSDTTVATIFLLIFLDLLESGNDRWNIHLGGAKTLMSLSKSLSQVSDPGRTVQEIRSFITKQIYLIETLGATFVRPNLLSRSPTLAAEGMSPDMVEQSFLGCPDFLLSAIQTFSIKRDILATASQKPFPEAATVISDLTAMLESIHNFDSLSWASNLPQTSSPHDIHNLANLSQCYKLGALIYGQRVLDIVLHQDTSQEHVTCELFSVIEALKDDNALFKCILWPIFVAGLESGFSVQHDLVMQYLERFWIITRCLNVVNAAKILQAYWQTQTHAEAKSLNWVFNMGRLGEDWLLI
ncbi:Zn(II)2Cys6 transcription factor [Aspergillus clavatus NRRL 1]|uniref:C6 transcription factor (Acr-2), putative n=1 Tax=Aspergillus clavatus (strain ATCC 1007 / CBS 513.65 / DSM 816 / NCTC 3887 / NRRL 1 / QM 1276 / 107) TaxID=344612 RepID=A1CBW3_ASPCL|nr:C6 transcription factor (Acr-2), putative [Aspergillus clavatus NRRL 1]EAW13231.1 C6 transcription factor (Acr-2), putative [Aspergillus clavatus NRRL 1]